VVVATAGGLPQGTSVVIDAGVEVGTGVSLVVGERLGAVTGITSSVPVVGVLIVVAVAFAGSIVSTTFVAKGCSRFASPVEEEVSQLVRPIPLMNSRRTKISRRSLKYFISSLQKL